MAAPNYNTSLVVLGSGSVGKSAFTTMYLQNNFIDYYDPTIFDSYRRQEAVDGDTWLFDIVDTAGQAEFASMRDPYIKAGEGFLLMYSVADRNSFQELVQFRDQVIRVKDLSRFPCVVVGNKSDLPRQVTKEEGEKFALSLFKPADAGDAKGTALGCSTPFLEASAKTNTNVKEAFLTLAREVQRYRDVHSGKLPAAKQPATTPTTPATSPSPGSPRDRAIKKDGGKKGGGKKGEKKKKEATSAGCVIL
eukprot:PhF_6_TR25088/c0_g1_i3/m.34453/K07827/KRAS, KRAS2; GTPase Kras